MSSKVIIITTSPRGQWVKLATDTSYLTLSGKLWGVCCEDFGENQQGYNGYNGTTLYLSGFTQLSWH